MPFELTFAVATGLIALLAALVRSARNIEDAQRRMKKVAAQKTLQVGRLRKIGRRCLDLRRAQSLTRRRIESAVAECKLLADQVRDLEAVDRRLFVLDDRRTPADRTYIAKVQHASYARISEDAPELVLQSWLKGRRFIVWALDDKKAREKLLLRYPERAGFRITALTAQALPSPKDEAGRR